MNEEKSYEKMLIFLVSAIIILLFFSGCNTPTSNGGEAKTYGAISVWMNQNNKNDWDIQYSLWDNEKRQWFNYENQKASSPIAVLAGNDYDPDIYSTKLTKTKKSNSMFAPEEYSLKSKVVAVWAHKTNNEFDVYYSLFDGKKWSKPKAINSVKGNDLDPTIALNENNALAVWVNEQGTTRQLYYSVYSFKTDSWSKPKTVYAELNEKVIRPENVSLPELVYNAAGVYELVFIGEIEGKALAFGTTYSNNAWLAPVIIPGQKYEAKFDSANPTKERTGIAANLGGITQMVWPAKNNTVYAVEWFKKFSQAKYIDKGSMPDIAFDSAGISHLLYTKENALYESYDPIKTNAKKKILDSEKQDNRNAIIFVNERRNGLTVWWSNTINPSEILYSLLEKEWSQQKPVENNYLEGKDLNPAITPLEKITVLETGWCPDAILDAGEQCEIGIPCKNKTDFCNLKDCTCEAQDQPVTFCGDGKIQNPNSFGGMEECEKGVLCANPAETCIVKACKCIKDIIPTPEDGQTKEISCNNNTDYVNEFDKNPFNKNAEVCQDDCPEGYTCWADSCTCIKEPTKEKIQCSKRTEIVNSDNELPELDTNNQYCFDDCMSLGKGEKGLDYYCNDECFCEEKNAVGCYENTFIEMTDIDFLKYNQKTDVCLDSCPEDLTCNEACVCVKDDGSPPEKVKASCSKQGLFDEKTENISQYDSSYMTCSDDCSEGEICNTETCICETPEKTNYSCSATAQDIPFDSTKNICVTGTCDSGYICNTTNCVCEPKDSDGDGIIDNSDNCINTPNADQADSDEDSIGDACDPCPQDYYNDYDKDGVCGNVDNCSDIPNHSQEDSDGDGIGDVCDSEPFGPQQCQGYAAQQEWGTSQGLTINVLAKGNVSQASCNQLASQQGEVLKCNTLCRYGYWKQWTWTVNNQTVNSYSCCWGTTKYLSCTDCPGQNPVCPQDSECAGYNPFPQGS